jgi:DNA polymerase III subunit gamma/tau
MLTPSLLKLSIPVSPISKERLPNPVVPNLIACLKYTNIIPILFRIGTFFAVFHSNQEQPGWKAVKGNQPPFLPRNLTIEQFNNAAICSTFALMENFVVSARKYRPATFDSVVGQQHITTTLKNAISSNHLAQAFLFCGPRGVGKTTCARILAKTINCQNVTPQVEACNECESCRSFNSNSSFNIHELDAASNNSVEDIRNLVDQVRYAPQTGKYKIYIIDEVHMLSNSAFNAFLKTLEEPPSYAIFILATTERHKIIPTILSRCQIFDFNRIRIEDMVRHLQHISTKEQVEAEPDALHLIAQKADGALRDALSIFDQMVTFSGNHLTYRATVDNLHILDYDYYFRLTDLLLQENLPGTLLLFDEILKNGFDPHHFVTGIGEHFRGLLVCKDNATVQLLEVPDNVKARYVQQANAASVSFLLSGLNLVGACDLHYKSSKNQRLHVELCLMKLAHLNSAVSFARDFSRDGDVKKKTDVSPASPAPPAASQPTPVLSAGLQQPTNPDKTSGSPVPSAGLQLPSNAPPPLQEVPSAELQAPTRPQPAPPPAAPAIAQEPPAEKVVPMPSVAKKIAKLPSLKDMQQKVAEATKAVHHADAEGVADVSPSGGWAPISREELQEVWDEYAQQKKNEDKTLLYTILNRSIDINEHFEIDLVVENPVQVTEFGNIKPELLAFLRQRLQNNKLNIRIDLKKGQENKLLYTSVDKYNYLAGKYPALDNLKSRLGLDTDF